MSHLRSMGSWFGPASPTPSIPPTSTKPSEGGWRLLPLCISDTTSGADQSYLLTPPTQSIM